MFKHTTRIATVYGTVLHITYHLTSLLGISSGCFGCRTFLRSARTVRVSAKLENVGSIPSKALREDRGSWDRAMAC